jgi:periplasmic protein TonB
MGYQALLFCPDEKLARVVSQVFSELEFAVDPVAEPFAAVKKLMAQHYDAIVVDCENEQNTALLFKSARNSSFNQGSLAIALVEGQAGVAKAYRIGANLVLTKPINVEQAKGTLRVARGLLRKNADAAAAAGHAPAAAPAIAPPAPASGSIRPAGRNVEAVVAPPVPAQPPEFEAPLPDMAAPAKIEERPVAIVAPVAEIKKPVVAQAPMGNTLFAVEEAKNAAAKAEAPKTAAAPAFTTTSKSQGVASAPAPAKEVAAPATKPPKQKPEEPAEVSAQPPSNFSSSMTEGPSFAALGIGDTGESGGSKKVFIVIVAVLALAAGAYFGWSKFGQSHPNPTPAPVTTTPQKGSDAVPEIRPMSTPATEPVAGPTNRASVAIPAPAPTTKPSAGQPTAAASSETKIAFPPEPEARKPASAPLLVKPATTAVKAPVPAEEAPVQLPSPLAVASPSDNALGGVLSSAASEAAKPTLARIKLSQGVSQGLVIKRVQPKYPANALAAHIQGSVQIEATVNKDGMVVDPKVLSGDRTLAAAAVEAVRQWRYKPYYLDGEPVEIQTQITVTFKTQ